MDPITLSILGTVGLVTLLINKEREKDATKETYRYIKSQDEQITKRILGGSLLVLSLIGLIYTMNAGEYQLIAGIITATGTAIGSIIFFKKD
jgi:hypothetical protein